MVAATQISHRGHRNDVQQQPTVPSQVRQCCHSNAVSDTGDSATPAALSELERLRFYDASAVQSPSKFESTVVSLKSSGAASDDGDGEPTPALERLGGRLPKSSKAGVPVSSRLGIDSEGDGNLKNSPGRTIIVEQPPAATNVLSFKAEVGHRYVHKNELEASII